MRAMIGFAHLGATVHSLTMVHLLSSVFSLAYNLHCSVGLGFSGYCTFSVRVISGSNLNTLVSPPFLNLRKYLVMGKKEENDNSRFNWGSNLIYLWNYSNTATSKLWKSICSIWWSIHIFI